MKTYKQFIIEVKKPSQQAKALGLASDGHGGWYNKATGEFEAKSTSGALQYFNKRQLIGRKDPPQTSFEKRIPLGYNIPTGKQTQEQSIAATPEQTAMAPEESVPVVPEISPTVPNVEKTKGVLNIAFGRFNPPTIGHQDLMDTALAYAENEMGDYIIVPSRSQDKTKNPLDPDSKIFYMRKMFPQHSERIVNDPNMITIFDVLKKAHNDGYFGVRIISGEDRVKEFEKLSNKYNGELYYFDLIEVIPVQTTDGNSKNKDVISSSDMRKLVAEGDFYNFRKLLGYEINKKDALNLFLLLRSGMNIKEGWDLWKIAPKLDQKTLREQYIKGKIYQIGDIVENLNTGLRGKIIRTGTNYLICVTEDKIMFKSWIGDVNECN